MSSTSVLEEEPLPGIEDVGLDAKLITQVGNGRTRTPIQ